MTILTSDNVVKLAFTLPFLPVLVVLAWKFGLIGGSSKKSQAYDPKTGIGRGAPGFQTNVRRIAVPRSELHKYGLAPEDEQRILEQNGQSSPSIKEVKDEWIPEGHSQKKRAVPSSAGKAVRKRK